MLRLDAKVLVVVFFLLQKQKQLLVKAKETQEVYFELYFTNTYFLYFVSCILNAESLLIFVHQILAKNARFEQIWKSRKGKDTAASDDALRDMCHLYDVVRVDAGETSGVHEEE